MSKGKKIIIAIIVIAVAILTVVKCVQNERANPSVADKPIIYLYPEETTELTVKLGNAENLTAVYPDYEDGWKVNAEPDGTLTDASGREYYGLYYECKNMLRHRDISEGFIVEREDIKPFLEEKLAILGLTDKEAEEFIIYWLPRLEKTPYVAVRFQTADEIEANMPLIISEEPNTLIRIMMEWKGLDKSIEIPEQKLEQANRSGFTVVEWGGTEIE
jgi:hypothetical protein